MNSIYYEKYLKYKSKYLIEKNKKIQSGNGDNPLFINKKTIRLTQEKSTKNFPYYCPNEYPYFCTINSAEMGLCKRQVIDCDDKNKPGKIPLIDESVLLSSSGSKFGYGTEHLHDNCVLTRLDYHAENNSYDEIPKKFTIMTYNIWGLFVNKGEEYQKVLLETMKIRMKNIVEEIKKYEPDIVCLQEMTDEAYNFINEKLSKIYKYQFEQNFSSKIVKAERGRDLEVFLYSKYKPKNIEIVSINGNLNYYNSFMIIEYPNLVIFNCHLQAGSKHSPGQEHYWYHYSRCRRDELRTINEFVKRYKQAVILVGDFNTDLGGSYEEWPESKEFKEMNLKDAWTQIKPNESGFTEDTDINNMRWNIKFQEKHFRYDGILYKGNIEPIDIKLVGKEPIEMSPELSRKFFDHVMQIENKKENVRYYNKENKTLALWPSDHFGLDAYFEFK